MIRILKTWLILSVVFTSTAWAGTRQNRDLAPFSVIRLGTSSDVVVKQGSPQSVRLEGDSDDLQRIETIVRGGELTIKSKGNGGWGSNLGRVTIYITIPEVEGLMVSGSGELMSDGNIESDFLELKVSGSGKIKLDTDAQRMESKISGSGRITLDGSAGRNEVAISGSGKLEAADLKAKEYVIRISGSGNCRVDVSERLEVKVSGSGNVYYRGEPEKVYSSISGSGNLRPLD